MFTPDKSLSEPAGQDDLIGDDDFIRDVMNT
jgi:hypothetical protein